MDGQEESGVTVAGLFHDLVGKQSFVTLVWDSDATKRVTLPVAFGTALAELRPAAEEALWALSAETATIPVKEAGSAVRLDAGGSAGKGAADQGKRERPA